MKNREKEKFCYVIDNELLSSEKAMFLSETLQASTSFNIVENFLTLDTTRNYIFFISRKNIKHTNGIKNKILVVSPDENFPSGVVQVNFNSRNDINDFVNKVKLSERIALIRERAKISEMLYEELKRKDLSVLESNLSTEDILMYGQIVDLELSIMREDSLESWNDIFKNFVKKYPNLQSVFLMKNDNFNFDSFLLDEESLVFRLPNQDYFLCFNFKLFNFNKDAVWLEQILTIVIRVLNSRDQSLVSGDGEIDLWKKVFSKIPYPMALISDLGDLIIYNESFAKIGILPKECLRFRDLENTEIFQNFYKIRKIDFQIHLLNVSYFVFYSVEKNEFSLGRESAGRTQTTNDELGIISSSIAHELNNPLAGILAALSLLSLEDDWSPDALADLEDMKSGAKRCKELVEIFLGFSRFSPIEKNRTSMQDSLDQAINLLRFRMIESNLRLELKYLATLEKFSHQVNSSVMSMIFYLIANELMTAFAHHRLIAMVSSGALTGEVMDFSNQIIIKLDENFEYEEKIAQSKLIQHLLFFEKLEISFLHQEIRLTYRQ